MSQTLAKDITKAILEAVDEKLKEAVVTDEILTAFWNAPVTRSELARILDKLFTKYGLQQPTSST